MPYIFAVSLGDPNFEADISSANRAAILETHTMRSSAAAFCQFPHALCEGSPQDLTPVTITGVSSAQTTMEPQENMICCR